MCTSLGGEKDLQYDRGYVSRVWVSLDLGIPLCERCFRSGEVG